MADVTYSDPILITGDMLATLSGGPYQQGNPGDSDFGIVLPDAQAMGSDTDIYRLVWTSNINGTDTNFRNGQGWTLQVYDRASDPDGAPTTGNDGWSDVPGYTNLTPSNDAASGLGAGDDYVVFSGGATPLVYDVNGAMPTTPTTMTYLGADEQGDLAAGDNDGEMDFSDSYMAIVCFASGTMIETPHGPRLVQQLKPGHLVTTATGEDHPIRWISYRHLTARDLRTAPHLCPIRIRAGVFGPGLPARPLVVSPQHRLLIRSRIVERMFGAPEVLIPAIKLLMLPGVSRMKPNRGVRYHHFSFDRHQLVLANGIEAESLYPGPETLRSIAPDERDELLDLFPALSLPRPATAMPDHARPVVSGPQARHLIRRQRRHRARITLAE